MELNFEINTYYQDGKPAYAEPITLNYTTNAGKGTITMDLVRVFPCTAHDINTIIDTLWKSAETYTAAETIYNYIQAVITDLCKLRTDCAYSADDKRYNAKITGFIKRYIANINKLADSFGFASIQDTKTDAQKMKKCEVVCLEWYNGKSVARAFKGFAFSAFGYDFQVTKKNTKNLYTVIVPCLGLSCAEYNGTLKEAPEHITDTIINMLNRWTLKEWEPARARFVETCEETLEYYTVPALPERLTAETSEETATDSEPIQGTTTPEPVKETKKPARNVIKRTTRYIKARCIANTSACIVGDIIEVIRVNSEWKAINTRNNKWHCVFADHIRNSKIIEIITQSELAPVELVRQYNGEKPQKPEAKEQEPITADNTPESAQVWKPCTMTARRFYGKIYYGLMSADRQQNPTRVKPFKAVLRLAKLQGCINIPLTAENPATGKIQAHNGYTIGTPYTPEPIPGKPPRSLKYYGIVNRRVPRFEIRGSPILHEKKIGGFCGVYIRPPGGYLKVSILKI